MKWLTYIEYVLVIVAMAGMSIITFGNVLSRYFFDTSFAFAEEITINLFVLATFIGASIAIKRQAHFRFQFLYEKMRGSFKRMMLLTTSALMLFFLLLTLLFGLELVMNQFERGRMTPALNIPQWLFTLSIPVGSLFCMIRTVESTLLSWKGMNRNKSHQWSNIESKSKELEG
ncbi:TRAP transporter small permease [Geomicrobium sediminis]|uniref:TRAP-type C4-dicarboxylate transport system permease small subunit n=1 Tax=Geomicrobium sediminis TaxID=1347788 RepID=A0ABS2PI78_9BACL|nr:TRAP transporter small permease [Geomicrobium sediminis]MBM7634982.1 TRAP-type C4-dicarboxylate transport system permease small subunit [Geomicrobium sediminis]